MARLAPAGHDYVGAFAVTAGLGIEKKLAEFEIAHDDYSAIMLKALADRLAEAATEWLHERVRKEYWGYAPSEVLGSEETERESHRRAYGSSEHRLEDRDQHLLERDVDHIRREIQADEVQQEPPEILSRVQEPADA